MSGVEHTEPAENGRAVTARATGAKGVGVQGIGKAVGVRGDGETWHGLAGLSKSTTGGYGVYGKNTAGGTGVSGDSDEWMGVYGRSASTKGGAGVMGENTATGAGVIGKGGSGPGLFASSDAREAVRAESRSTTTAALAAYQMNASSTTAALYATTRGSGPAARFEGDVDVTGDVRLVGADLAEHFEVAGALPAEPGSVMVLAGANSVRVSDRAYDRRVAGVVSGAGDLRPALVLGVDEHAADRRALALSGKVWVLLDADHGAVEVGDLLTTSPTPGHAMRATDLTRAFGTVIGKALDQLSHGRALIRALVALQ